MQEISGHLWNFSTAQRQSVTVLPDGCRDVIVRLTPHATPNAFITSLDQSAYQVDIRAGEMLFGLRLSPGTVIDTRSLALTGHSDFEPEHMLDEALNAARAPSPGVTEALALLSFAPRPIPEIARTLGVSERTLRRTVADATGWPPSKWLALARVRHCARSLVFGTDPLAGIAAHHGYADQAHMNREVRRWFRLTPNQLRLRSDLGYLLSQPGFS